MNRHVVKKLRKLLCILASLALLAVPLSLVPEGAVAHANASTEVTSTTTQWSGNMVVNRNVTINSVVTLSGNTTLTVAAGKTLTLKSKLVGYGAHINLTIEGPGSVRVEFPENRGNGATEFIESLTVNGGAVTFQGDDNYAIRETSIVMNGGTLTAVGRDDGAGIVSSSITMNGGTLNATGGANGGPGIVVSNIVINKGKLTATGGDGSEYAGIGIMDCNIQMNGGVLTAIGGNTTGCYPGSGIWTNAGINDITLSGGTLIATVGKSQAETGVVEPYAISCRTLKLSGGALKATAASESTAGRPPLPIRGDIIVATGYKYMCDGDKETEYTGTIAGDTYSFNGKWIAPLRDFYVENSNSETPATLQEALYASPVETDRPVTVRLLSDIETDTTLSVGGGKNIILDLNGHCIIHKSSMGVIEQSPNSILTLTDTSTERKKRYVTLENGRADSISNSATAGTNCLEVTGGFLAGGVDGGVYVSDGSTFNMTGGTICGNTTSTKDSILEFAPGSVFNMTGGTISGNMASGTASLLKFSTGSTFNISGAPIIKDNSKNVEADSSSPMNVTGALGSGAEIHVTGDAGTVVAQLGGGRTTALSAAEVNCFKSDDLSLKPFLQDGKVVLSNAFSDENLTIGEIADQIYTGNAITPCVTVKDGDTTLVQDQDYTISYENNVNAGEKTAVNAPTVVIAGKGRYNGEIRKKFTILKVDIPDNAITAPAGLENLTYRGSAQALVQRGSVEGNVGTVYYAITDTTATTAPTDGWTETVAKATYIGDYKVWYKVIGDANHNNVDAVALTNMVTIAKSTATPKGLAGTLAAPYLSDTVGKVSLPTGWSWDDSDKDTALQVGVPVTKTAKYSGADQDNYEVEALTKEVTITRSACKHPKTKLVDKVTPTSDKEGYSGDTYCLDCGALVKKGDTEPKTFKPVTVNYVTHIQNVGWEKTAKKNGETSGTTGSSLRLEGICIKVTGNENLGIRYTTHCQDYGWLAWSRDGEMSGTEGESKRLEAIMINLTGADKDKYDVYYRVHAQNVGWMNWAKNGEAAGTAGYGYRLEALQIEVVKKGEKPVNVGKITTNSTKNYEDKNKQAAPKVDGSEVPNVSYRTHVQNVGWQAWKVNGGFAGTSGRSLRLEGINIKLTNKDHTGGIRYKTHIQNLGWEKTWRTDGEMSGTSGRSLRLEAIDLELYGDMAEYYDIYYRVHAQDVGWMGWAANGADAGTAGYARRLEGIQVVLVAKGAAAPAANYGGITSVTAKPFLQR